MVLPVSKLNVSVPGEALRGDVPEELTFRTTGTVVEVLPDAMLMKPAYVPAGIDPGLTEAESTCGVVAVAGVTESQPPLENALTVKLTADELSEVTTRFCGAAVLFALVVNVS